MPPKVKVTKEAIINAAVNIVRSSGAQAINARTIASVLNCSTQPVFSNFATMDELCLAVVERADILCQEYSSEKLRAESSLLTRQTVWLTYDLLKKKKNCSNFYICVIVQAK